MDVAAQMVDKEIEEFERKLKREYEKAQKQIEKECQKYLKKYQKKDKRMQEKVKLKQVSREDYITWRMNQLAQGRRYQDLVRSIEDQLVQTNVIAANMVNDATPRVYTENVNYAMYDVERGIKAKTSFSLYNTTAVRNSILKGDMYIPKASVDIPKDRLWNRKKVQSVFTQSVIKGDSIPEISKSLQQVTDANKAQATRTARTCMTAVQNDARIDGYMRARELGIDVKKGWLATLDNRTRQSHRHIDGEIVELEDEFSNGCHYPGDPGGKPEEIYNCRCTLVPKIGNEKMLPMSMRANNLPAGISYEDWKGIHGESWSSMIKAIRERAGGNPTMKDIKDAGRILAKEVNAGHQERADRIQSLKAEISDLGSESYKGGYELADLMDERNIDPQNAYKKLGFKSDNELKQKIDILDDRLVEIEEKRRELLKELDSMQKSGMDYAQDLRDKLAEVREMGTTEKMRNAINNYHLMGRSPMRKYIATTYEYYPTDWVEHSIDKGHMTVGTSKRGYYWHSHREIKISNLGGERSYRNAVHELGHRFEWTVPGIKEQEKMFYAYRTEGEELKWLGQGYKKNEVTRKDDFVNPYMGKDYGGSAYELVSMGFEYAYFDPYSLMKDKDMQEWILGMLAIL